MIIACPQCGAQLTQALQDGLAACAHCNRVFDGSLYNRLLSASWLIRKHSYNNINQLISTTKLPEHEAILVYSFVSENTYSFEEFEHTLKKLGITDKTPPLQQ